MEEFSSYIRNKAASTLTSYRDQDITLDFNHVKMLRMSQKPEKFQRDSTRSNKLEGVGRYLQSNVRNLVAI